MFVNAKNIILEHNDMLKVIIETDPRQTLEELFIVLKYSDSSVRNHMDEICKVNRWSVLISHELSPEKRSNRVQIC